MDYNPVCPAWGILTWPKVGEFNMANGVYCTKAKQPEIKGCVACPIRSLLVADAKTAPLADVGCATILFF
jgi:hypothetical protein